jgi:hypothetical protein
VAVAVQPLRVVKIEQRGKKAIDFAICCQHLLIIHPRVQVVVVAQRPSKKQKTEE